MTGIRDLKLSRHYLVIFLPISDLTLFSAGVQGCGSERQGILLCINSCVGTKFLFTSPASRAFLRYCDHLLSALLLLLKALRKWESLRACCGVWVWVCGAAPAAAGSLLLRVWSSGASLLVHLSVWRRLWLIMRWWLCHEVGADVQNRDLIVQQWMVLMLSVSGC